MLVKLKIYAHYRHFFRLTRKSILARGIFFPRKCSPTKELNGPSVEFIFVVEPWFFVSRCPKPLYLPDGALMLLSELSRRVNELACKHDSMTEMKQIPLLVKANKCLNLTCANQLFGTHHHKYIWHGIHLWCKEKSILFSSKRR